MNAQTWFEITEDGGKFTVHSCVKKFSAFEEAIVTFRNYVGEFDSKAEAEAAIRSVRKAMCQ